VKLRWITRDLQRLSFSILEAGCELEIGENRKKRGSQIGEALSSGLAQAPFHLPVLFMTALPLPGDWSVGKFFPSPNHCYTMTVSFFDAAPLFGGYLRAHPTVSVLQNDTTDR
jgi:hypothetical protein